MQPLQSTAIVPLGAVLQHRAGERPEHMGESTAFLGQQQGPVAWPPLEQRMRWQLGMPSSLPLLSQEGNRQMPPGRYTVACTSRQRTLPGDWACLRGSSGPPRGPKAGERSSAIPRLSLQAAGGAPWPLTERPLRLRPGQGGGLPSLPHAPWLPHLALCPQPHPKHPSSSVLLIPSSPLGPEHTPHRPLVFPNQVSLHPK